MFIQQVAELEYEPWQLVFSVHTLKKTLRYPEDINTNFSEFLLGLNERLTTSTMPKTQQKIKTELVVMEYKIAKMLF